MTKKQLEIKLDFALHNFAEETKLTFDDPYDRSPATKGDAYELSKQVFYALSEFKKIILDYLP